MPGQAANSAAQNANTGGTHAQNLRQQEMDGEDYIPPCRTALRAKVTCEACQKTVSLHTLRYRHVCQPLLERIQRGPEEAHAAVRQRAEAKLDTQRATKYAHLVNL